MKTLWRESRIKRCPFCNGAREDVIYNGNDSYQVRCNICGACGPECYTKDNAVELWNQRTVTKEKGHNMDRSDVIIICLFMVCATIIAVFGVKP